MSAGHSPRPPSHSLLPPDPGDDRMHDGYPGQGFFSRTWYKVVRSAAFMIVRTLYGLRRLHRARVPKSGPLVIVCNHQSHFDPPIVSFCCDVRATHFMARDSLFKFKPFGALISSLQSFPVSRGDADTAAIKEAVRRVKMGGAVLLFPEGTRSRDGEVGEFKRGALLILKRAKCPVLPIGLDGPIDAFPRTRTFPRLFGVRIAAVVGEPISYEELFADGPDAALDRLRAEVARLKDEASQAR